MCECVCLCEVCVCFSVSVMVCVSLCGVSVWLYVCLFFSVGMSVSLCVWGCVGFERERKRESTANVIHPDKHRQDDMLTPI